MGGIGRLRVLHVPAAVGGNPQGLARAERKLGLDSVSVVLSESPFGYEADEVLRTAGIGRVRYEVRRLRLLLRAVREFDVVHFNFGRTMLPPVLAYRDLPLLRRAGKVVAVTFQGDDVRRGDAAPPWPSVQAELPERYGEAVNDERRRRVAAFARHAHLIWYLNPDLARVLPAHARFIPYAHVDPRDSIPPPRVAEREPLVVVHAPSDRAVKGTRYVVRSVERLRREGTAVDLRLVEGVSHDAARAAYTGADVAVDQLFAGWYGASAVETMALAIPTVTYIRQADLSVLDPEMRRDLPLVSATSESLTDVLRSLVTDRERLRAVGVCSRAYVERWHDPSGIAATVKDDYERFAAVVRRGGRYRK